MTLLAESVPTPDGKPAPAALEAGNRLQQGIPSPAEQANPASPVPLATGMPTGQAQPEQSAGLEIANAMGM